MRYLSEYNALRAEDLVRDGGVGNEAGFATLFGVDAPSIVEPAYEPEALAIFAAATTPPTVPRKIVINTLVKALKDGGVWSILSLFYVPGADSQISSLNWINPGSYTLTAVNSPSFTADRGWLGNGSSNYLATGWDPATDGGSIYQRNDAHIGRFGYAGDSGLNSDAGSETTIFASIKPANTTSSTRARVNNGTVFSAGSTTVHASHGVGVRRDSANIIIFQDGVANTPNGAASSALTTDDFAILKTANSYAARYSGIFHCGGALSDAQVLALYNACYDYLNAIGAYS